jgi:hypothetical protein
LHGRDEGHAGAIACYDLGFSLDGWEIDKEYLDAAIARFEAHTRQKKLFQPVYKEAVQESFI